MKSGTLNEFNQLSENSKSELVNKKQNEFSNLKRETNDIANRGKAKRSPLKNSIFIGTIFGILFLIAIGVGLAYLLTDPTKNIKNSVVVVYIVLNKTTTTTTVSEPTYSISLDSTETTTTLITTTSAISLFTTETISETETSNTLSTSTTSTTTTSTITTTTTTITPGMVGSSCNVNSDCWGYSVGGISQNIGSNFATTLCASNSTCICNLPYFLVITTPTYRCVKSQGDSCTDNIECDSLSCQNSNRKCVGSGSGK
ncbi:unnamed protein product [Brachionus calyciflorus]|uniref:Uncharacterized protein n=1 Tax=Brachionus calyciflorus TaxID=104777 RepID=A0A814LA57_9BILA|nr:unnamed protein product [Brachionus calyciflorus]